MRLLLAFVCSLVASAAVAETIRVRAGEHSGYTRLVFDGASAFDWRIGRTETGYGLAIAAEDIDFDPGGTDRDLRAGRVTGIRAEGNVLYLDLGCDCRAESFTLSGNRLVVDIRNGAPRADAATEEPLMVTEAEPEEPERSEAEPSPVSETAGTPVVTGLPDFIGAAIDGATSSSSGAAEPDEAATLATLGGHSEFETMLVETLSRAASEGFVTSGPAGIETGDLTIAAEGEQPVSEVTGATGKTAYDMALDRGADAVAPDACAATGAVDFLADPSAFTEMAVGPLILEAYAEDGSISPPDALSLARYLMAGGYGAEAAQLIDLAGDPNEATAFLHMVALAVDGRSAGADVDLARYAPCPGAGGLWALLAGADGTLMEVIDLDRAIATLSGYSPRLRSILGPLLVTQLLTRGRPEDARLAARVIPPRLGDDGDAADHASLSDVLLDDGGSEAAVSALDAIIRAGGPETHDAVLLKSLEQSEAKAEPTEAEIETLRALQADADPDGQAGALFLAELRRLLDGSEFVTVIDRILADHPVVEADALAGLEREAWSGLVALGSNFDLAYALRKWPGRIDGAGLEPGLTERLAARIAEIGGDLAGEPAGEVEMPAEPEVAEAAPVDSAATVLAPPKTVTDIRALIGEVDAERAALEALLADSVAPGADEPAE